MMPDWGSKKEAVEKRRSTPARLGGGLLLKYVNVDQRFGLYKIFVYFKAFVHERLLIVLPLPICIANTTAIPLHDYRAVYDPLPTPISCAINHSKLVLEISCKGQSAFSFWVVRVHSIKIDRQIHRYIDRNIDGDRENE